MVNCPYAGKCRSEGVMCESCKNNKDIKEDHYEPFHDHWKPYKWYYSPPQYDGDTIVWCGTHY